MKKMLFTIFILFVACATVEKEPEYPRLQQPPAEHEFSFEFDDKERKYVHKPPVGTLDANKQNSERGKVVDDWEEYDPMNPTLKK